MLIFLKPHLLIWIVLLSTWKQWIYSPKMHLFETALWTFTFCFLSSTLFLLFLPHFFFLSCWAFSFILMVGNFRRAFRILRLDERKGRWEVEQDVHGNFRVNVAYFLVFFCGLLDLITVIMVWFEWSLLPVQVSWQSFPWPLKRVGDVTSGRRDFRGE